MSQLIETISFKLRRSSLLIVGLFWLSACSPLVQTNLGREYPPLEEEKAVMLIGIDEVAPLNAELLGTVEISDPGMATNCSWEKIIERAEREVRAAGGNILKITRHIKPTILGSGCHQISADILRMAEGETAEYPAVPETTADYATIYLYRWPAQNDSYNIHLGDSTLGRVGKNFKMILRVQTQDSLEFWAHTHSRYSASIVPEKGKSYYLRCGSITGPWSNSPHLEWVDEETGAREFAAIDKEYLVDLDSVIPDKSATEINRFAIRLYGGYGYLAPPVVDGIDRALHNYIKSLKHGYHTGGDLIYYFTESLGLGLRYSGFRSSGRMENAILVDENGVEMTGTRSDNLYYDFYGLLFSSRFPKIRDNDEVYINISAGYMAFRQDSHLFYPLIFTGSTLALVYDLGYDFSLSDQWSVGVRLSYISGAMSSLYVNNGVEKIHVKLAEGSYEGVHRLDAGLSFSLKL